MEEENRTAEEALYHSKVAYTVDNAIAKTRLEKIIDKVKSWRKQLLITAGVIAMVSSILILAKFGILNIFQGDYLTSIVMIDTVSGYPIMVNEKDSYTARTLIHNGAIEHHVLQVAYRILGPGDIAIDVASGYGYHAVGMAKKIGQAGRLYAFEAQDELFRTMLMSLEINGLTNFKAYNAGIFSDNRPVVLYQNSSNPSDYQLTTNMNLLSKSKNNRAITSIRLDQMLQDIYDVRLMMIHSYYLAIPALQGASNIIHRSPNLSIILPWDAGVAKADPEAMKIMDNFTDLQYEIFAINENGSLSLITLDQLSNIYAQYILITRMPIDIN
jgi:FkbM family methyltransferase